METVEQYAQKRRLKIGQRIKHCRKAAGLSQYGLARALSVEQSQVWKWEHGWHEPFPDTLDRIAEICRVTTSDLTCGDDA